MKIYNEIIIDMNPESSSYGDTLHEDSFEYEGEMMLMQAFDPAGGYQGYNYVKSGGNYYEWIGSQQSGSYKKADLGDEYADRSWHAGAYDWDFHHVLPGEGEYTEETKTSGVTVQGGMGTTEFTYKDGKYAPTLEEYKESVQKYGGLDEVAAGFAGLTGADFDEFYFKPLEKLGEDIKFAGTDYTSGLHDLGLKTGQSLYDINKQAGRQMSVSGLESSGAVDFTTARARKSVFGEYKSQQKALETSRAKAISDIGFREDEFWKGQYDQFWTDAEELDADLGN
jgi:hypothetical protein|tara:strand:- start:4137 stop:4982 length:846 start_codon:yes stop_codon:yes gene_type:complete